MSETAVIVTAEPRPASGAQRVLCMLSLVIAGEAIFGLPFQLSRFFRPSFVEVFGITQTQLGQMGALYGITATISYFLGGGLADKFSPRSLLAGSLIATGLSGFYLYSIPSPGAMRGLYAFWGVSTILPFWSALVAATRDWGGTQQQGRAFGLLDGGRGLLAALLAMSALFLFAQFLPAADEGGSLEQKTRAIQAVILVYTLTCFIAAALIWIFLPGPSKRAQRAVAASIAKANLSSESLEPEGEMANATKARTQEAELQSASTWEHLVFVLRLPAVWYQALVIVCAYCTFKGVDFYSQYARDLWGWSDVQAAGLSAFSSWMRPVAAVAAGFLADRLKPSTTMILAFGLTAITSVSIACMEPGGLVVLLWASILVGCLGIFAMRGIYFALLEESKVPLAVTGTAVGVISFIGYTPDIFMPLIGGLLIDGWEGGQTGYRILFGFLTFASLIGIVATLQLRRSDRGSLRLKQEENI